MKKPRSSPNTRGSMMMTPGKAVLMMFINDIDLYIATATPLKAS
jgi:hypothetical protein